MCVVAPEFVLALIHQCSFSACLLTVVHSTFLHSFILHIFTELSRFIDLHSLM